VEQPAAIRPNIAWRSWRLMFSCSLDEPVGHRVERLAEVGELVAAGDLDPRVEVSGRDALCRPLQGEDRRDEAAPEDQADDDHHHQREPIAIRTSSCSSRALA
jgi:hypothetical protein